MSGTDPRTEGAFAGSRGVRIVWRRWLPEGRHPRARVLVVHGYGDHGGRYAHLAERLAASGHDVIIPDHRGHGRSGGRPLAVTRFDDYVGDLQLLMNAAVPQDGSLPTFMLGHSLGGLIAMAFTLEHERDLAGLILSAPALLAPPISPLAVRAGRVLARIAPDLGTVRLPVGLISRDPNVVAAYRVDPLVRQRRIRARLGAEILRVMGEARSRMPGLRVPVLLMQGTGDAIVDPGAARYAHDRIGSPDRTLIEYPGLYHEILNEPERDQVIQDMLDWLEAHHG